VQTQLPARFGVSPQMDVAPTSDRSALRWAGVGGIVFATTVIVQNVLKGASAPANDANSASIVAYFVQHAPIESLLVVMFTVGGFGLAVFAGGVWARCTDLNPRTHHWAQTGVLGVAGIVALFSALVACEIVLLTAAARADLGMQIVALAWLLHNAIFGVLTLSIAVALLGLSQAAVGSGLIHPSFRLIGVVGACLLAFNTALAPLIVASSSPLMAVGLVGFAGWVAFVIVTSYKLLRS